MRHHPLKPVTGLLLLCMAGCANEDSAALGDEPPPAAQIKPPDGTVPVLAWQTGSSVYLQKASATGAFSAAFHLTKPSEPPPQEALQTEDVLATEPHAIASIVALPSGYPAQLHASKLLGSSTCSWLGDSSDGDVCTDTVKACGHDGACATMVLSCDNKRENCQVTSVNGNAELFLSLSSRIRDRSYEHSVLYLAQSAAAGSVLSQLYGKGAALAAGYHLLENLSTTPEQSQLVDKCFEQTIDRVIAELGKSTDLAFGTMWLEARTAIALAKYNEKHGTHHASSSAVEHDPEFLEILDALDRQMDAMSLDALLKAKCLLLAPMYAATDDFDAQYVSFSIRGPVAAPRVGDKFAKSPAKSPESAF